MKDGESNKHLRRSPELRQRKLQRLRSLSRLLDSAIPLPGGYRIGLDGIFGLVPGVGDVATGIASGYIILEAARMGVSIGVLLRMVVNVLIESLFGIIPVLGDLFDFAWKANEKNVALLEAHDRQVLPEQTAERRLVAVGVIVLLVLFTGILLIAWLVFQGLQALFGALGG